MDKKKYLFFSGVTQGLMTNVLIMILSMSPYSALVSALVLLVSVFLQEYRLFISSKHNVYQWDSFWLVICGCTVSVLLSTLIVFWI